MPPPNRSTACPKNPRPPPIARSATAPVRARSFCQQCPTRLLCSQLAAHVVLLQRQLTGSPDGAVDNAFVAAMTPLRTLWTYPSASASCALRRGDQLRHSLAALEGVRHVNGLDPGNPQDTFGLS